MASKRTGYAPWSLTREAGVQSATVDGTIEVPQYIQPTLDTGFVDEKGDWKGIKSSDREFIAFQKDEGVPNGAAILTPSELPDGKWPLDMTGYSDLFIAIKPSNGGNYNITAVMGPDTVNFANLNPVNAAAVLRGATLTTPTSMVSMLVDGSETLTADVWNIFSIGYGVLKNQKLLQFSLTNNSGGSSDIETAYMRLV